ncbi:hypothetical protein [Actinomyces sp. 432]|uniref:hypothetical protein n=1 Tax=Actinomyces sp. 432 TaxID=2057798 RepID=UPI001F3AD53A|nr:hypothetical protein [Actinomyces sp. 432]
MAVGRAGHGSQWARLGRLLGDAGAWACRRAHPGRCQCPRWLCADARDLRTTAESGTGGGHAALLGERGVLEAAAAILLARPPASSFQTPSDAEARARYRREQAQSALEVIRHYNTAAPVCTGIPFGHTRPQWILPHGGALTVDAASRRITASYA